MAGLSEWDRVLSECRRVGVDTSVVIYYLDRTEPYVPLVEALFRRCEEGALTVLLPTLVETELLVAPIRAGESAATERIGLFLDHFPHLEVLPIDRHAARAAARYRAQHGLATPDALIVGCAAAAGCDAVIGNDRRWASRFETPRYLVLADYARRGRSK